MDRGDLGELTEDSGESHTLIIGDELSLLSGSSSLMPGLGIFCCDNDNILGVSSNTSNICTVHWSERGVLTRRAMVSITGPHKVMCS